MREIKGPLGLWNYPVLNQIKHIITGNPVGRGSMLGGPRRRMTGTIPRGTPGAPGRPAALTVRTMRPHVEDKLPRRVATSFIRRKLIV